MFKDYFKGKKVLITGHTGFKGSWLTSWLLHLGADIAGFSIDIPTKPSMFEQLGLDKKIEHHIGDIQNFELFNSVLNKYQPDIVIHLAAQAILKKSYTDPIDTIKTNVLGTIHVLEALKNYAPACTALFITSDKCYETKNRPGGYKETDPLGGNDMYSASKASSEIIIHAYINSFLKQTNKKITTARAGNIIGGGDWTGFRLIPDCMRAWSKNQSVELRNPNAIRPWQHVLEALSGYLWLAKMMDSKDSLNSASFNFGPTYNTTYTVLELVESINHFWQLQTPYSISKGATFGEDPTLILNCQKAVNELQWETTLDFQQTMQFTSEWYKAYYYQSKDLSEITFDQINSYCKIAQEKTIAWAL